MHGCQEVFNIFFQFYFLYVLASKITDVGRKKDAPFGAPCGYAVIGLQLRASLDQLLARLIAFVLGEVLDEAGSQILRLLLPFGRIGVGVARIENSGIDARQLGRHLEVKVRDLLGRRLEDGAIEDRVDDTAGILNGCLLYTSDAADE